jgi:hypothetical protein
MESMNRIMLIPSGLPEIVWAVGREIHGRIFATAAQRDCRGSDCLQYAVTGPSQFMIGAFYDNKKGGVIR